ncbi:MAG: hypothetical protein U0640_13720 [Phycisphaerales bacterium]
MALKSAALRLSTLAGLALVSAASAQPVLIMNNLADDISSDGTKATGLLFDAAIEQYAIFTWDRAAGFTRIPATGLSVEPIRASNNLSVLATGKNNDANWGNLNCFAGYCTFGDCTPGEPLPSPNPCSIPTIAHSWTSSTGWINAGSLERVLDTATNRYYGGTRCDSNINSVNDISGDGRYMVGGAWWTGLTGFGGGPASGQCGDFYAFIADRTLNTVTPLPVQVGTTTSRADYINNDGSVITGYDIGEVVDPEFGPYSARRSCVWTNGVQTILNTVSPSEPFPVNGTGTTIAGLTDPTFNQATFGINAFQLVRWTRQPNNSWTPEALGVPVDFFDGVETKALSGLNVAAISSDGNTIVGTATYGFDFFDRISRAFIWKPTLNDGTPIDLGTYLDSAFPGNSITQPGITISGARCLSADGNAIAISLTDARTTCTPQNLGLFTTNQGMLYLNGSGISCSPPAIAVQPVSNVSIQYTPFGVSLNVFASGTWPMTYQWQREDPQNPGQWLNLSEACSGFPYGGEWDFEGVAKSQLRVGQATCGNGRDGNYRCIITNSCGTVTSTPATVTFQQGTLITQQPENIEGCPNTSGSAFAVAVSNSHELTEQWEITLASAPNDWIPLVDGANTLPDGRGLQVFGATGQFIGMTPTYTGSQSNYLLRCQFISPCGGATSTTVTYTVERPECPLICDSIDFNNDFSLFDPQDIEAFLSVYSEGPCIPAENICNDFDFNNDTGIFDPCDFNSFLLVYSEGPCTICGE